MRAGKGRSTGKRAAGKPRVRPSFGRWFFDEVFKLLRKHGNATLMWLGLGYIAHQASIAAIAFAGESTLADVNFQWMSNVNIVWTSSFTVSGLAVTLYLRERSLHRATRERLAARITELEKRIHPARTSSNLTSTGLTRKEDE